MKKHTKKLIALHIPHRKLAPRHPLHPPAPPLLQNKNLPPRRHVSLPYPQCRPPWRVTRTTSTEVKAIPNPKLAKWRLEHVLMSSGAVLQRVGGRMTGRGFGWGVGGVGRTNGPTTTGRTKGRVGQEGKHAHEGQVRQEGHERDAHA